MVIFAGGFLISWDTLKPILMLFAKRKRMNTISKPKIKFVLDNFTKIYYTIFSQMPAILKIYHPFSLQYA
jgi:hypothetical protein